MAKLIISEEDIINMANAKFGIDIKSLYRTNIGLFEATYEKVDE